MVSTIVTDVDGTLTDGMLHIGENGELFKSFYARDGLGILNAIQKNIRVVFLTSRRSKIVERRAKELQVIDVLQGVKNKEATLREFVEINNLLLQEIAYIGDDINDLEAMSLCGVKGCPADAVEEIKKISDFISRKNGGKGAVREFIDWLLE